MSSGQVEARPVGRPSKYKPEYCEMLVEHMENGLSFESFAGTIDVSREVLYDWEKVHEEFLHAKKRGFAKCQLWWEKAGNAGLWGNKDGTFNTGVWVFSMKNRFKWNDKVEVESTQQNTITLAYRKHE